MRGGSSELNIDSDNSLHVQESKFRDELSGLAHLDKSGLVRKEGGNMQGHGSFSDLFIGVIERENINSETSVEQSGSEIRVAIKRLRVNISHDKDFLKVNKLDKADFSPF